MSTPCIAGKVDTGQLANPPKNHADVNRRDALHRRCAAVNISLTLNLLPDRIESGLIATVYNRKSPMKT